MSYYLDTLGLIAQIGLFLACLIGLVAGLVQLFRGRVGAGLLALLGFALLALQPLVSLAGEWLDLWRVLSPSLREIVYIVVYVAGPVVALLALAVALLLPARPAAPTRQW